MNIQLDIEGIEPPEKKDFHVDVKRANESIGVRPLTGKLTLLGRRLYHLMIHFIQIDGNREIYRRSIQDFIKSMEYESRNVELIKETLLSLMDVTVEWNSEFMDIEKEEKWNSETISKFVAEVEIMEKEGRGREVFVEWSFPPKLRNVLLNPKLYTRYTKYFFKLKSAYSLALFEIIERYKSNPSRRTCKEPWEWWVPVLMGFNYENPEYKYFKRDVLKVAITEINKSVKEYSIALLEHKEGGGRKITHIQFEIILAPIQEIQVDNPGPVNADLLSSIISLGIAESDAKKYFTNYSEEDIKKSYQYTLLRIKNKKVSSLGSPAAYFANTLAKGYANSTAVVFTEDSTPEVKKLKSSDKPKKVVEITPQRQYEMRVAEEAKAYFEEISDAAKLGFIDNFLSQNKVVGIRQAYSKQGMKSTMFKTAFFSWLGIHIHGEYSEEEDA